MSVEAVSEALGVEVGPMDRVSITVASPVIRSWSKGEVKNPETINYRTFQARTRRIVLSKDIRAGQGLQMCVLSTSA